MRIHIKELDLNCIEMVMRKNNIRRKWFLEVCAVTKEVVLVFSSLSVVASGVNPL